MDSEEYEIIGCAKEIFGTGGRCSRCKLKNEYGACERWRRKNGSVAIYKTPSDINAWFATLPRETQKQVFQDTARNDDI